MKTIESCILFVTCNPLGSGHNLWVGGLPRFRKSRALEFRPPLLPWALMKFPLVSKKAETPTHTFPLGDLRLALIN